MHIVEKDSLPTVRINDEVAAYIFDGGSHGEVSCSAFIVDLGPDLGPKRHTHPYEEVFVIVEGIVRLEADGEVRDVTPAEICVVPAGVPHTFINLGPGRARLVNIHPASEVVTHFVEDGLASGVSYEYNQPSESEM